MSFFSDKILKKLGYGYTFVLYFACFALQLGLISLVPIWWILPIELITQGSSYALSLTTMTAYMNIITPPGSSATVQGLFQGLYAGVGKIYAVGHLLKNSPLEKTLHTHIAHKNNVYIYIFFLSSNNCYYHTL